MCLICASVRIGSSEEDRAYLQRKRLIQIGKLKSDQSSKCVATGFVRGSCTTKYLELWSQSGNGYKQCGTKKNLTGCKENFLVDRYVNQCIHIFYILMLPLSVRLCELRGWITLITKDTISPICFTNDFNSLRKERNLHLTLEGVQQYSRLAWIGQVGGPPFQGRTLLGDRSRTKNSS